MKHVSPFDSCGAELDAHFARRKADHMAEAMALRTLAWFIRWAAAIILFIVMSS